MRRYETLFKPNTDNWLERYLREAISEYELFTKIELPNAGLHSKLQKIIEAEFEHKRNGYYFTMGFIDETCRLCKKCGRPLTCDNSLSRPSWKLSPELQIKYDLKEGQGILLIGPAPPDKRTDFERENDNIVRTRDEIGNKYGVAVYSIPASEIIVTWMTVLQCMYGCRVYSNFSRRWSCVPFCPSPDDTKEIVSQYDHALILNKSFSPPLLNTTWLGTNVIRDVDQKLWATRCYGEMNKTTLRVESYLLSQGYDVYTYGMSPCHVCVKCTYPRACKQHDLFRFSADACGIDIYGSAIRAGAKFEIPPKNMVNLFEILLVK